MSERVKLTVRASGAHPDVLTIQDALRQVLDYFDLLVADGDQDNAVAWNLVHATTNSPLTVEGEAVSLRPDVDVSVVARRQKMAVRLGLTDLVQGRVPGQWISTPRIAIAQRLFERNLNGVGSTSLDFFSDAGPILITPAVASRASAALAKANEAPEWYLVGSRAREERGSLEGVLIDVGTHYGEPAVRIRERKSGQDIWCRISKDEQDKISKRSSYNDVWQHRRVVVRGRIRFRDDGRAAGVIATSIDPVHPREMTLSQITDPDFTGGMSAIDYLEKLREGDLG